MSDTLRQLGSRIEDVLEEVLREVDRHKGAFMAAQQIAASVEERRQTLTDDPEGRIADQLTAVAAEASSLGLRARGLVSRGEGKVEGLRASLRLVGVFLEGEDASTGT